MKKLIAMTLVLTGLLLLSKNSMAQTNPPDTTDLHAYYYMYGYNLGYQYGYADGWNGQAELTSVPSSSFVPDEYQQDYEDGFWASYGVNYYLGLQDYTGGNPPRTGGNPHRPLPISPAP